MTFLLENPKGDAAFAKLMTAPVSAPRTKIPRAKVAPKASRPCSTGTSLADYLDSLGIFCVRRADLARVRHEECTA